MKSSKEFLYVTELLAVGGGAEAGVLTKQPGEMVWVLKTAGLGNGCYGQIAATQQFLAVSQPDVGEILMEGLTDMLSEQLIQVIAVVAEVLGNGLVAGDGSIILLHIVPDRVDDRVLMVDLRLMMEGVQKTELQQRGAKLLPVRCVLPV